MPTITPKPMSGFPELLPAEQIVFNRCLNIVRTTFERYGFAPIETPSVERKEVLTSKGGNEKEIYALSRLAAGPGESADTDFALHFDLTVPLARYVVQHKDKLVFPFRRYQIQKVWRGERPQAGRYRELYQCDIDMIGRGSLSLFADAEMPSVIYQVFNKVFSKKDVGGFIIRISNRRILQGYFEWLDMRPDQMTEALHAVDDLEKIGRDKVSQALINRAGLDIDRSRRILQFIESSSNFDSTTELLGWLKMLKGQWQNATYDQGVTELTTVVESMRSLGVPDDHFKVDLTVVRGLDYYTGTVYETKLLAHPDLGSICSGGRYDDLASFFTNEKLPGVGISIGFSRLMFRLIEAGVLHADAATPAPVLVTTMDQARMQDYLRIAAALRQAGIATEVFFEKKGLGDQLKYANRKGFSHAVIAGGDEFSKSSVLVRNLADGVQTQVEQIELANYLESQISNSQHK